MRATRQLLFAQLAIALLAVLPHLERIPVAVALFVLCLLWRAQTAIRNAQPPNRWLLAALVPLAGIAVAVAHWRLGTQAWIGVLIAMIGLKLLESKDQRDQRLLLLAVYFLIGSRFIRSQDLLLSVYLITIAALNTALMIALSRPAANEAFHLSRWLGELRLAGKMLLIGTPLALLLFVLFPRLSGPLWGIASTGGSQSGLSDEMTSGEIGALSLSGAVAFRVRFDGEIPAQKTGWYWRGPVLERFDGKRWQRAGPQPPAGNVEWQGEPVAYEVLLEPHGRRWLFALELPRAADLPQVQDRPVTLSRDWLLQSEQPIDDIVSYRLESWRSFVFEPELELWRARRNVSLPDEGNPRTRGLVAAWQRQGLDAEQIVHAMLNRFRNEAFFYTLQPPLWDEDGIDQFLFDAQGGFCEHYAASFVFAMRAAGIPARIVTGYLGGEANPFDEYITVRQSDAHAWTEVWLEGKGWLRVDPTAAVAPERVEGGLQRALNDTSLLPLMAFRDDGFFRELRLRWEATRTGWSRWVVGYDGSKQSRFLEKMFGIKNQSALVTLLAVVLVLFMVSLSCMLALPGRGKARPEEAKLYDQFCKRLARVGVVRLVSEPPLAFAARASESCPDSAEQIQAITTCYLRLRYASGTRRKVELRALRRAVSRFNFSRCVHSPKAK